MRHFFRLALFFCVTVLCCPVFAGNYSVRKGSTIKVNCTATAPADGWITHAFYSLVNPEDEEYLGISYASSDLCATFYGLKKKSNIKVEVTYAYSYKGSYDNNIHVGHASYYDYITVTGAPDASGVEFREGSKVSMRPGASVTLHADLKPSGADGYVTWGFVNAFGKPYNFELVIADDGLSAIVTAKKTGYAYLMVMVDNDQQKNDIIELVCSENAEVETPTGLALSPSQLNLLVGETGALSPEFTPSTAWADLTWSSDKPSVATVDKNGKVTAVSGGTAVIKATSSDGSMSAESTVVVKEAFSSFSLPYGIELALGFTYTVAPVINPENASDDLKWSSSDTSIATVSSTGVVTAKGEGTCTITAKSNILDRSETMTVTVNRPASTVMDHRNLRKRIQAVKSLVTRSVINK